LDSNTVVHRAAAVSMVPMCHVAPPTTNDRIARSEPALQASIKGAEFRLSTRLGFAWEASRSSTISTWFWIKREVKSVRAVWSLLRRAAGVRGEGRGAGGAGAVDLRGVGWRESVTCAPHHTAHIFP
jgi:hypothetical protein